MIDGTTGRAALDWLAQRFSVGPKYLAAPAPSRAEFERAAALAARAPDHQQLRPYRFVRVPDDRREQLAVLFEEDARRRGHGHVEIGRARERAHNGPALVALVVRIEPGVDDAPEHEQWICAGAALMNFLNALHLMGYAAKVLSGASVRDVDIQAAFCSTDEHLVAWIVAGTATRGAHAREPGKASAAPLLCDWN